MDLKNKIILILVFLISILCFGAVSCFGFTVTAQVDKFKISREDSVFLKIEVNGGKAELDLSMIKDFNVIKQGTSSSFNYINGKSERKSSYQFVLQPFSMGKLRIPAIKATRKGETAFTKEIIIDVEDQIVNPDEIKALFAKAFVAKDQLFTGEQTVFTLQFFNSRRLSGVGFEKPPEFIGFSAKPFEEEKSYSRIINGVRFNVTEVNYLLIPPKPGVFTIDPAVLIARVTLRSNSSNSFFLSERSKPVRVISNPVKISVLPLPQFDGIQNLQTQRVDEFSGLVGQFDLVSNIDKTDLQAGESATLTIKISGAGNIMDASLPEIDFNSDIFKVYDDHPVETIHLTSKGYTGFKIFKKAIVPVKPGEFEIKPVSLIYFDVDIQDFKLISTKPVVLDVSPSQEIHLVEQPKTLKKDKSIVKKEVALVNKDILEIKEGLKVLKNYREIDLLLFVLFLSIPAILFSGLKLFIIIQKKEIPIEKQMIEKAKLHLKKAGKLNKEGRDFLSHLYTGLVSTILAKGHKKGETVTIKEAGTILKDASIDDQKIQQITALLENIESIRFGGKILDENKAKELLAKTKQILKMICIALVCMGIFTFTPQKAIADSTATFIDAIKDYKAGEFEQAAMKFEIIAQNKIKNPYLYYNIGNAYLKAKDIGHAILWYERAKRIIPNDPDLNFNLDYANGFVKDKKEDQIKIVEILFFWDKLISVKLIQIIAVCLSFIFFIWAAIQAVRRQKVFSGFGIILFSIFIIFTAIVFVNYYKQVALVNAVIVTKEAPIRSGMTETATKLFTLHAGTKIKIIQQRDGYLKVKFSKDKIGWVAIDQAVII